MYVNIPGFEDYLIGDDGTVISLKNGLRKILKQNKIKNGYYVVYPSENGKKTALYVHKIVAETFLTNPNDLPVVNHKDGDKSNNSVGNLEFTTYSKNNEHAYRTGLKPSGENFYNAKLTEVQAREIKRLGKYGTFQEIADRYGVTKATIRDIIVGRTWKNIA